MVLVCGNRNKQTVSWSKIQCHSKPLSKRYQSVSSFSLFLNPAFTNFHEHCHSSIKIFTQFFHNIIISHFLRNNYRIFFMTVSNVNSTNTIQLQNGNSYGSPTISTEPASPFKYQFFTEYQSTHHSNPTTQVFHLCLWWRFQPLSCPSSQSTMKSFNSEAIVRTLQHHWSIKFGTVEDLIT